MRDVATLQAGRAVTIGCNFAASILYARLLGLQGFGEYAVVLAYTGVFGLLTNLGQEASLTTFLGEAYGRRDRDALRTVSNYYVTMSFWTGFLMVAMAMLSPILTEWIYGNRAIGILSMLVFASSIIDLPSNFVLIALQTVREIRLLTLLENGKTVLQLLLAALLLFLGYGVAGVLWSSALAAAALTTTTAVIYPRIRRSHDLPSFPEMCGAEDRRAIWKYCKDGLWIALDKSIGALYPNIFLFIFSTRAPLHVVGLLRLAFKLADLPSSFVLNSVSRLASSVLSTLAGQNLALLRQHFVTLTKYTLGLYTLVSLAAAIVVPVFLPLVYGEAFRVAVYPFLVILALQLGFGLHTSTTPVLRVFSKIYLATLFNGVAMLTCITLFFALQTLLPQTRALYVGLLAYHLIVTLLMIPTWNLLRRAQPTRTL